jgi:hypothetical protein
VREARIRRFDGIAEGRHEAPGEGRRGLHRDLLPEDRAHRDLEAVDRARKPKPRMGRSELAERERDLVRPACDVEELLHAREDRGEGAGERGAHDHAKSGVLACGRDRDPPGERLAAAFHAKRAVVALRIDALDTRDRAFLEEGGDGGPVVGRAIGDLEGELVGGARWRWSGAARRASCGSARGRAR